MVMLVLEIFYELTPPPPPPQQVETSKVKTEHYLIRQDNIVLI